jgi:hypothetical protein
VLAAQGLELRAHLIAKMAAGARIKGNPHRFSVEAAGVPVEAACAA